MPHSLRVLIDARMLMGRFSGVARMVTRLVEHLARMPHVRVVALCGSLPYEPWMGRNDLEMIVSDFSPKDRSPLRRLLWEATRLRHWIAQSGADVFHATWNTGIPFRCPVPAVLTVHDIIPWSEPAFGFSAHVEKACYRSSLRSSVRRAQRVMTVSGFTADKIVQTLRLDPSQTRVIHNGVDAPTKLAHAQTRAVRPYVLYVGGHEPRKNIESVFKALERYWLQHDPTMELHLTGSPHQLSSAARSAYDALGDDRRIQFLGAPGDEELAREFSQATALLMLSRAEGFGLPVIEAMAHGCPVIAAHCGSLPEIVGDAGILVGPDDVSLIADSIHIIAGFPGLADSLIDRGRQRAAQFTWHRAAESYAREYELALSNDAQSAELSKWRSLSKLPQAASA